MNTHEAYGSLRELISEIKAVGLSDPVVKPEVALKVIDYFDHVFYCKGKLQTQYFLCRQMLTAQYYDIIGSRWIDPKYFKHQVSFWEEPS